MMVHRAHGRDLGEEGGGGEARARLFLVGKDRVMNSAGPRPEETGLKQLCLSLRDELKRFLVARQVSASDADDLLQELFVRLEKSPPGPVRAPRAYLYQMADNLAHLHRRTNARRDARDLAWSEHQAETQPPPTPEAVLLARDHLAKVGQCLDALPERTADIFRQYRLDGVSQKAIAQEFGISLSAVEKHLQRAYRAIVDIRRELEGDAPQEARTRGGSHG